MSLLRLFNALGARQAASIAVPPAGAVFARGMAEPAGKAAKVPKTKSNAAPAASNERGVSLRLNEFQILKDVKTVEELPDKDYPEWLWTIHVPDPTLADLKKIGFDNLTEAQQKRYFKLERRAAIKDHNSTVAKS